MRALPLTIQSVISRAVAGAGLIAIVSSSALAQVKPDTTKKTATPPKTTAAPAKTTSAPARTATTPAKTTTAPVKTPVKAPATQVKTPAAPTKAVTPAQTPAQTPVKTPATQVKGPVTTPVRTTPAPVQAKPVTPAPKAVAPSTKTVTPPPSNAAPGTVGGAATNRLNVVTTDTAAASRPLLMMREVFSYEAAGRRDPFRSLLTTTDLRPTISDLRLLMTVVDEPGRSVALLQDSHAKQQQSVRVGTRLGRMRVTSIRADAVMFTIEEFGMNRRDSLLLRDSTKMRRP